MMPGSTKQLTVVIPVYNREKKLARCLDSIAAQSCSEFDVIVVDDGSTDGSADVARSHPVGAQVVEGEHAGAAAARNAGLARVMTPWTMFFDSDDTMLPDHIGAALSAVADGVDLIGWDVTELRLDGRRRVLPFEPRDIGWHNIMHGTLATQRYMARTDLFRRAGAWNPAVSVWDDIELGARLLALNPEVVKIGDNCVFQRVSSLSISGLRWIDNIDRYPAAFEGLERTLGADHADWIALKKAILAADIARENLSEGKRLFRDIRNRSLPVRIAYHYRRLGGRGAARLLRPFFSR